MKNLSGEKSKALARALASGGALLAALGLAYLFLTPKIYQSTARIKVVDWVQSKDLENGANDRLMPAECERLRSGAMLDQVAQNLKLGEVWGRRLRQNTALSADDVRNRLKLQTLISPVGNSSVLEIRFQGNDREETARIVNEFARLYLDYRRSQHEELLHGKLEALKQQWDEQSRKIGDAQAEVDKLYFAVMKDRATNTRQYFDAEAYDSLRNTRVKLEAEFITQQQQLNDFKKMDPEDLKQVLSAMDPNSVLIPAMEALGKAKSRLRGAKSSHAADSPEVAQAAGEVELFDRRIKALVPAVMQAKENDLAELKSRLEALDQRLKSASTNVAGADAQYPAYHKALENLQQLKRERDDLKAKMDAEESHEAILPPTITAELIDPAEPPARPFIPDSKLALGAIGGGGAAALAGFILLLAGQRSKAAPQTARGATNRPNPETGLGKSARPGRP